MPVKIQKWHNKGEHVAYIPAYKNFSAKFVYATSAYELDRKLTAILGKSHLTFKKKSVKL